MERRPIHPGRVAWSGERSEIRLRAGDAAGPMALLLRVVLSPHGRGHLAVLLGAPGQRAGWPDAPNLVLSDNHALGSWLMADFVSRLPGWRDAAALADCTWRDCREVATDAAGFPGELRETLSGDGVRLELRWQELGDPVAVETAATASLTGRHDMYGVGVEAGAAAILLNGEALAGTLGSTPWHGRSGSGARLSLSETWVSPPETRDHDD